MSPGRSRARPLHHPQLVKNSPGPVRIARAQTERHSNVTNNINIKEPLTDQLRGLETALDTPPVPGEITHLGHDPSQDFR